MSVCADVRTAELDRRAVRPFQAHGECFARGEFGQVFACAEGDSVWKLDLVSQSPAAILKGAAFQGPYQTCLAAHKGVGPEFLGAERVLQGGEVGYATRTQRMKSTLSQEFRRIWAHSLRGLPYPCWHSLDAALAALVTR